MNGDSRFTMRPWAAGLTAVTLLLAGAGATYLAMRSQHPASGGGPTGPAASSHTVSSPEQPAAHGVESGLPAPEVVVPLSHEAVQRAGLVVATVESVRSTTELRLPGLIHPNGYKQVVVTPLVSGRVTRVAAELGQHVRHGQTLAQIYSPEVADAQSRHVSARAMLEAHERELQRVHALVDIGAASRQELERIHAEHDAQTAAVRTTRAQLDLLGVKPSDTPTADVTTTIDVLAPIDGIVVERGANAGLNVEPATRLFAIVDLSTVWVVADVSERDLAQIHVGSDAMVTAYPDLVQRGRIGYIDPQLSVETRTARLRVEIPNPHGALRLGMYVDVVVASTTDAAIAVVPRSAVQNVGDRFVVYVVSPEKPDAFIEREVRLGSSMGERVAVTAGVKPGDSIVTQGSFFLRAERERRGLGPPVPPGVGDREPSRTPGGRATTVHRRRGLS